MEKRKPNILIFNPDQMRADTLAHLGNPASKTPFLDEFSRKDAVSFRYAFCQNTVCVPSRCSFLTGLYPHVNGHRTMNHMLRRHETSLLKELKDAGYYVWMNARNDFLAAQEEGIFKEHAADIFYGGDRKPAPGTKENVRGGPGSKHFYSFYMGELDTDENGKNETVDDEAVQKAAELILEYDREEPFCMFLALQYPHPPYQIEEPYFSAIDKRKLKERVTLTEEEMAKKPKILSELQRELKLDGLTEADWDELRSCYLGMCQKVDDYFKMVCDALKEKGIYEDTAIFFFSDHGDYTGDYGIVEKTQNTFEDCLVRVPFLIKPPASYEVDPGISDSLVELVDFYATAMEMSGVQPAHSHFGKSLLPILRDRQLPHRRYVYSEGGRRSGEIHCDETNGRQISPFDLYYPRKKAQQDDVAHTKATMIRTEKYKYIRRLYESDEFYDLEIDPQEKENRIEDEAYAQIIAELRLKMLEWYQDTCDVVPYDEDERFNFEMIWHKVKAFVRPGQEEEVKRRIRAGENVFLLTEWLRSQNKQGL